MKKQKISKNDANVEDISDDSGDDSSLDENVDVEFEAFGLGENDVDGISSLLKQLFMKDDVEVTEISKILIDQVNVGCIFMTAIDDDTEKNDDSDEEMDNEIYGVVSILNLTDNEDKISAQQIKTLVQKYNEKSGDEISRKKFSDFLQSLSDKNKKSGLLINERLVNLPHHIALPALKALLKDIDKVENNYEQFIAILKMHKADLGGASSSNKNKNSATKRKRTNKKLAEPKDGESIFVNAEEEFLFEECDAYFDYLVEDQGESSSSCNAIMDLKPYRRIVLFNRAGFNRFIEKLDNDIRSHCN